MDHLPIDSYCICIFFPLRPAFNNTYYCWWNTCILDLTLERVTFREECNIMMFSFLFYASNEIELRQIGQVLTEIWKSADSCISPSKPVRFASFLCHWMRKRNIRTLLYYSFLWMSAILVWKMEKYMMEFATESLLGIESDPARLNWMAGPLFPSFTGWLVPLPLMEWLLGIESDGADSQALRWKIVGPRELVGHVGMEKCRTQGHWIRSGRLAAPVVPLFPSFTGSVPDDSLIQFSVALAQLT